MGGGMTYTAKQYNALQVAYDHFNARLWGGRLPACLITLQRKARARGYFLGDGFIARVGDAKTDEIALNPDSFASRTDREILSTLVHEMCHLWQHHFGREPRRCYHDREWAGEMERIGLVPSDTGFPGGKRVGQHMTHYILTNGPFDLAVAALLDGRTAIDWASGPSGSGPRAKARAASARSKTKYQCVVCGLNAWAKPGATLACANFAVHDMALAMLPVE